MSTQKRTPKALQTEQNILHTAKTLFSEKGYELTTTKEISECAEVAEGTVFKYFPTKRDILSAVMQDFFTRLHNACEAVIDTEKDPYQQLRGLIYAYVRFIASEWNVARLVVQYGRYGDDDTFIEQFVTCSRPNVMLIMQTIDDLKVAGRIRASTPTPLIRDTLFGSIEHFAMRHFPNKRPYDLDKFVDHLLDLLAFGFSTGVTH